MRCEITGMFAAMEKAFNFVHKALGLNAITFYCKAEVLLFAIQPSSWWTKKGMEPLQQKQSWKPFVIFQYVFKSPAAINTVGFYCHINGDTLIIWRSWTPQWSPWFYTNHVLQIRGQVWMALPLPLKQFPPPFLSCIIHSSAALWVCKPWLQIKMGKKEPASEKRWLTSTPAL